jgi:hypothetical protein
MTIKVKELKYQKKMAAQRGSHSAIFMILDEKHLIKKKN